jgi:hypothetical protein
MYGMFWRFWDTHFGNYDLLAWYVRIESDHLLALTELMDLQNVLDLKNNLISNAAETRRVHYPGVGSCMHTFGKSPAV